MRRSRVLLAAGLAAATVATGAGTAYAGMRKTVDITVDGQQHRLHTFAGTVSGALQAEGVRYSSHDLVVPDASSTLRRNARITVRHAKSLALTIDGQRRTVWVLADSVGQALDQLGLGSLGAALSASRSRPIPSTGMALTMRLPHDVTLLVDGKVRHVVTVDPTVLRLLVNSRIVLAPTDTVSVPLTTAPADGATIRVTRIRSKVVTDTVAIPYSTVKKPDAALYQGKTRVGTAGRVGALSKTYLATYVDGKLTTKKLTKTATTAAPVTSVVYYGTKAVPAAAPAPKPGSSSHSGSGYGGLNWAALAACESGGNPRAVNPTGTYRGLYQFSIATWQAVGGSGDPINASASEQTYRAWVLYQRSGAGQWPVCGRNL